MLFTQSILLADFKENHTLLWFLKILTKIQKQVNSRV
jgi:hypothetical protein